MPTSGRGHNRTPLSPGWHGALLFSWSPGLAPLLAFCRSLGLAATAGLNLRFPIEGMSDSH